MIYHGEKKISKVFHGDREISRVYRGDNLVFQKNKKKKYNDFCEIYDYISGVFSVALDIDINKTQKWSIWGQALNEQSRPLHIYENNQKSLTIYCRLGGTGLWLHAFNGTESSTANRLNGVGTRYYFCEYDRELGQISMEITGHNSQVIKQQIIELNNFQIAIGGYSNNSLKGSTKIKKVIFDENILQPCKLFSNISELNSADKKKHVKNEIGIINIFNDIFYPITRGAAKVYNE